jgi:hypothetical protein
MKLALDGRILFGSDLPNVAVPLPEQIQAVFQTFAEPDWSPPSPTLLHDRPRWWTSQAEAHRAGKAVEQVLFGAANSLLALVKVPHTDYFQSGSKM